MMLSFTATPFLRTLLGSVALLCCLLVINACSSSKSTQTDAPSTRTLSLTAYDSTSGQPLDSARAVNRTFGDTLETDSAGTFVLRDFEPALYIFDVGGYGYHTQRHVSVLVEPDDTTRMARTPVLPKQLTIDCEGRRPFNWSNLTSRYKEDSTQVRIQLIDVFAEDGEVRVQPVVVNDLPTTTLFLPDNFGKLGHYEVQLYDDDNTRIPFAFENAPHDDGNRIYSKADILPIVPQAAERLQPATLVVEDSVEEGTTIYARMRYTFSTDDTLRATSATTFPNLDLDSLQVPVFDTLRTDGRVRVPDSLVVQRDTTRMRIVGVDTTVTRSGYTLFSTLRDGNAAASPQAARNLLYVPDSVKARAERDSLLAAIRADTTVPRVDTAALRESKAAFHIVRRTDRARIDSLILDDNLKTMLAEGLPSAEISLDSLFALPSFARGSFLETPTLTRMATRRGLDLVPDTTFRDSLLISAPVADSLFQLYDPDSMAAAEQLLDDSTLAALGDTTRPGAEPTTPPDTAASDTALADTAQVAPPPRPRRNPFLVGSLNLMTPTSDSIPIDSLGLTVPLDADSVVVDSVLAADLQAPPENSYWHVPDSLSLWKAKVMVVDSSFFQLRARPHVDTSASINLAGLLPRRVGARDNITTTNFPQQVIRSPVGSYRKEYLAVWKQLQTGNLQDQYCRIFPFPLRTDWRSTSMR
jgi:hypothetical protein